MRKYLIGIFALLLVVFVVWLNSDTITQRKQINYERVAVLEVIDEKLEADSYSNSGLFLGSQRLMIEILSGEHCGEQLETVNYLSLYYNVLAKEGMELIASIKDSQEGVVADIYSYHRVPYIMVFVLIFVGCMLCVGGKKGIRAVLGLVFTLLCIFYMLIPMIFKGIDPIISAIIVGGITTLVTLTLTSGFSKKTLSAILGTVLGVVFAAIASYSMNHFAQLTIFNTKDAEGLVLLATDYPIKLQGVLFAGVIIASLGAVMDVGISVASAMDELYVTGNITSQRQLFISGMNIGKDMMGTMTNTLVLAFVGSSISLLILLYAYNLPLMQLLNTDMIALEIVGALSGTMGIIATVPLTAFISSYALTKFDKTFTKG